MTKEFSENALDLFKQGKLRPVVDQVFPFEKIAEAHHHMEENKNIGKIIIKIDA